MLYNCILQVFLRERPPKDYAILKRNHVSILNWIQMYKPQKIIQKKMKVMEFIIYKRMLKVSNECVWLCVAFEPLDKIILEYAYQ